MLHLGRHPEVALEPQSLAAAYPFREQFHAQRALALYRGGRQSEALDALRKLRGMLADEVGLDPGQALQALEERILRQDPDLDWQSPDPVSVQHAQPAAPTPSAAVPIEEPTGARFPVPHQPPPPPRLLGRDRDLEQLVILLGAGTLVTLTGPAGIG